MGVSADLERTSRWRVALGAGVVLLLVAVGCAVLFSALAPRGTTAVVAPSAQPLAATSTIFVHVLGEVVAPGLYELREGDRAVDAIAAAGGYTEKADESATNLARFVTDGEQLIVPEVGASPGVSAGASVPGKVNLNTADAATLETLPRIGPAMSARILAWREANGRFTTVEDLQSVSGIGAKTFEALRDLVTV
jgi:competence protein ComEA